MARALFGKPLTDAENRLTDLREAGYTGPVDQDGYPVTSGPVFETLAALRQDGDADV